MGFSGPVHCSQCGAWPAKDLPGGPLCLLCERQRWREAHPADSPELSRLYRLLECAEQLINTNGGTTDGADGIEYVLCVRSCLDRLVVAAQEVRRGGR